VLKQKWLISLHFQQQPVDTILVGMRPAFLRLCHGTDDVATLEGAALCGTNTPTPKTSHRRVLEVLYSAALFQDRLLSVFWSDTARFVDRELERCGYDAVAQRWRGGGGSDVAAASVRSLEAVWDQRFRAVKETNRKAVVCGRGDQCVVNG